MGKVLSLIGWEAFCTSHCFILKKKLDENNSENIEGKDVEVERREEDTIKSYLSDTKAGSCTCIVILINYSTLLTIINIPEEGTQEIVEYVV